MNRIIRNISPSYPWMWMAILSATPNSMNPANSDDPAKGLVKAAKTVAKYADIATKLLSGDLSAFVPLLTGVFEDDMLFSSLIKAVDLPTFGYTMEYSDLGFVRYPHASQVMTEGFNIDFMETQDNAVSRYMLDWQNRICPSIGKVNSGSAKGDLLVSNTGNLSAFTPLAAVARTLYVIKLRRSTLLALANLLVESGNDALKGIWNVQTGIYETPVQIYCFPQVVPQSFKEAKLDKTETNSLRTVSVRLDRVPILRYPSDDDTGEYGRVTKEMTFLSGVLGASRAIDSLTDTALGLMSAGQAFVGTAKAIYGIYDGQKARELVSKDNQPEVYTDQ
jgi:hypothetical protein